MGNHSGKIAYGRYSVDLPVTEDRRDMPFAVGGSQAFADQVP